MHLKSYEADGRLLRTGAANFSASGLKRQDNDLVVIESADAAAAFKRNFEVRFASGRPIQPQPGELNPAVHRLPLAALSPRGSTRQAALPVKRRAL